MSALPLLQSPKTATSNRPTDIAVASFIRQHHATVFITRAGCWGLWLEQLDTCLCTTGRRGDGCLACRVATQMVGLNLALETIPGTVTILCTSRAVREAATNWLNGSPIMPRWYSDDPRIRRQAPCTLRATQEARHLIMQQRGRIRLPEVSPGSDPLLEAAFHLVQIAAQSKPSPEQGQLLRQYFELYIKRNLP